jgi:hypothetical protein
MAVGEEIIFSIGRWDFGYKIRLVAGKQIRFCRMAGDSHYFDAGDEVEVITGPLAGLCGLVNGPANQKHRAIVSIELLRRSVALEIDSYLLRRAQNVPEPEEDEETEEEAE